MQQPRQPAALIHGTACELPLSTSFTTGSHNSCPPAPAAASLRGDTWKGLGEDYGDGKQSSKDMQPSTVASRRVRARLAVMNKPDHTPFLHAATGAHRVILCLVPLDHCQQEQQPALISKDVSGKEWLQDTVSFPAPLNPRDNLQRCHLYILPPRLHSSCV